MMLSNKPNVQHSARPAFCLCTHRMCRQPHRAPHFIKGRRVLRAIEHLENRMDKGFAEVN